MLVQGLGGGRDVEAQLEPVSLAGQPRDRACPRLLRAAPERARARRRDGARSSSPQRNGDVVLAIADEGAGADGARDGTGLSIVRALVADELHGSFALAARAPRWCSRREDAGGSDRHPARGRVPRRPPLARERRATGTRSPAASRRARRSPKPRCASCGRRRGSRRRCGRSTPRSGYLDIHVESFIVDVPPDWEPTLDWEHDEYRWLPREQAAELLFYPEPAALLRAPAVSELWHVQRGPGDRRLPPAPQRAAHPRRAARLGRGLGLRLARIGSRVTARAPASTRKRTRRTRTSTVGWTAIARGA